MKQNDIETLKNNPRTYYYATELEKVYLQQAETRELMNDPEMGDLAVDDLERLTATERLTQDCMTRARIHRVASKGGFYAMVAKYGVDEQERAIAVNELVKLIDCDASSDFKRLIIWTWASIKIKRGFIERIVDMCEQSRRTVYRKKKLITEQLNDFEKGVITDTSASLSASL